MPANVHEIPIRIQPADIDELGHVNNVVYLRWVQEAATAHWQAVAPLEDQEKLVWVVVRHEIDYRRAALPADEIVARTWIGSARATFERLTEIVRSSDGAVLAKARTIWCPLDRATERPTMVSQAVRERFPTNRPPAAGEARGTPDIIDP